MTRNGASRSYVLRGEFVEVVWTDRRVDGGVGVGMGMSGI